MSLKKRESYIVDTAEQFVNQYKQHKGITTALVTSAAPLDESSKNHLLEMIKTTAKSEVELEEKVKPELLGGFVVRIGDTQVDASVLRQIKNLKRSFSENPYVKEF